MHFGPKYSPLRAEHEPPSSSTTSNTAVAEVSGQEQPARKRGIRYRAFGERFTLSGSNPARRDPSFQNRTYDAGLGIYDYRNRSFDPATGRFLQRDPVLGGDSLFNPYVFPTNNPVGNVDPMGTDYINIRSRSSADRMGMVWTEYWFEYVDTDGIGGKGKVLGRHSIGYSKQGGPELMAHRFGTLKEGEFALLKKYVEENDTNYEEVKTYLKNPQLLKSKIGYLSRSWLYAGQSWNTRLKALAGEPPDPTDSSRWHGRYTAYDDAVTRNAYVQGAEIAVKIAAVATITKKLPTPQIMAALGPSNCANIGQQYVTYESIRIANNLRDIPKVAIVEKNPEKAKALVADTALRQLAS